MSRTLILSVLFLSLLSGCGFALRGAYKLPVEMKLTYVDAVQKNSEFVRKLKRSLKASDIKIANQVTDNAAVLKIFKELKTKRIVSVDSRGRAREYTLTYAISFNVSAPQSEFEIAEQEIKIDRDFVFDTEDVLGRSREESKLYEEMQTDLIRLLLMRLQSKA